MKCSKCGTENWERAKFCDACGTPLGVLSAPEAKPMGVSLERSTVGSAEPGRTRLLKLNCPNCSGALELPDNLTIAHCIYCGTKILLDQDGVVQERRDLSRYIELCKVAVEAKNHKEAIEYCNRILEIDPKNIEAWTNKAVSTFWLTTGANNRFDEAMEYLTKASQIAPDDARILSVREELTLKQAGWLHHLSEQEWKTSIQIYNIYIHAPEWGAVEKAQKKSEEYVVKAMNHLLVASDYAPQNLKILEDLAYMARDAKWIQWSEKVHAKIRSLEQLRAKLNAASRLPKSREELQEAQLELAKLQTQSGFFVGMKINDVQNQVARLQSEIAKLEKAAA